MDPPPNRNVGILLDHAGSGKTVVMRDVLIALEQRGASVLAIKADQQLSGIQASEELRSRLVLPERPERVASRLGALGATVVIVDQVDALSLSLARDQKALDVVLGLVARLRIIPGVAVLLSCRIFDRNTDPRLKRIEVGREFRLSPLSDDQVAIVLAELGVDRQVLSPATHELLRTPLHLDLFASLVWVPDRDPVRLRGLVSLQELYGALWDDIILRPGTGVPHAVERERVLRLLTQRMDREQRTSVSRSVLSAPETADLAPAAEWLASAGILLRGSVDWTFLHQTFFDYCYARFFVDEGRQLSNAVLESDQGLFTRPQIVQVLSYLRGTNNPRYLPELNALLRAEGLRFHLRDLLFRWFGALPDPSDDEWLLARRLLADPATRIRMLRAMAGNPGWFARLRGGVLSEFLAGDTAFVDIEVLPYLASLVGVSQTKVADVARGWLDQEEPWPERVGSLLLRVGEWGAPEMIALYEEWLRRQPFERVTDAASVDDIAKADPVAGSRILRFILEQILSVYLLGDTEDLLRFRALPQQLEVLNGTSPAQAMGILSTHAAPFLQELVPFLERAVASAAPPHPETIAFYYAPDPLSSEWYNPGAVVHHQLVRAFKDALVGLGKSDPDEFQTLAERLACSPYATPQRLLANAFRELAPSYADDALQFLLADPRRLGLGDNEAWETRKLIETITPHVQDEAVQQLERFIIAHTGKPRWWDRSIHTLRWRGLDQVHLLQSLPRDRLSDQGCRILAELERKFPGEVANDRPTTMEVGWTGPPISAPAIEKMSDAAWLRAMAKYAGGVQHKEFLRGGARELARVLTERVKAEPKRFFAIAQRAPDDLDDVYVEAFAEGLAQSGGAPEWVFAVVRRFAPHEGRDICRRVAWSLEKVVEQGHRLPPDLLSLLGAWVRQPPGEDEAWREEQNQDLLNAVIHTDRGTALRTLMHALATERSETAAAVQWEWIERVADDSSVVLRAGALRELVPLIRDDPDRAVDVFEQLVVGYPRLLVCSPSHDFLYWASFGHFERLGRYIAQVMESNEREARQRGAELGVLAYLSERRLESAAARDLAAELAERAITGSAEWRRGAARIFSHNLVDGPTEICVAGLRRLLDDEDENVRWEVASVIRRLGGEHIVNLRGFLSEFASSRSMRKGASAFAEYLWEHGLLDPVWALKMVHTILDNTHYENEHGGLGGGQDLVRLVLRIYTDPTAEAALRQQAMDTFDRLMERYAYYAVTALNEWDRR